VELNLSGRTALVTGASLGLGYACARELSREGARLAICARDAARLAAAARQISGETGGEVAAVAADLTRGDELAGLIAQAKAAVDHIDILVVGTGHPDKAPFSQATDDQWQQGIDLMLRPAITLAREVLTEMRQRRYGRLVFIGSIYGLEPEPTSVVQSTLRGGLNALSKCIATEAAADGVTANVICPGYFDTPLVADLARRRAAEAGCTPKKVLDGWRDIAPSKMFGRPDDLGALVAFLASPRGEFVNGTSIAMDGGAVRRY
jgi:3-oxoacyl-[acyl-carrier protein] reductase